MANRQQCLKRRFFSKSLAAFSILAFLCLSPVPSYAQNKSGQSLSLIRDAEVEADLRTLIDPILDAAGIDKNMRLVIVQDSSINAFVAGGQNMFIHTGLLLRADHYTELMGVVAHEAGHITGGHLARREEQIRQSGQQGLILQILAGAAMALGHPDAGMAVMGAGAQTLQSAILSFSRTQENSADQAGLLFLQSLGVPASGLLDVFAMLQQEQKILFDKANPYLMTHPLTESRIDAVKDYIRQHPQSTPPDNEAQYTMAQARLRAKLMGFLSSPQTVLYAYPVTDQSVPARYARAIMEYKQGNTSKAVTELGKLIAEYPDDPYFYEMRGQVILEEPSLDKTGSGSAAIRDYQKALDLAPHEALIRLGLVQALLAGKQTGNIDKALAHLQEVLRLEPRYGLAWQMESIAQGRAGHIGKSALALSELALLQGDNKRAREQANRAISLAENDPATRQRAEDIKNQLKLNDETK